MQFRFHTRTAHIIRIALTKIMTGYFDRCFYIEITKLTVGRLYVIRNNYDVHTPMLSPENPERSDVVRPSFRYWKYVVFDSNIRNSRKTIFRLFAKRLHSITITRRAGKAGRRDSTAMCYVCYGQRRVAWGQVRWLAYIWIFQSIRGKRENDHALHFYLKRLFGIFVTVQFTVEQIGLQTLLLKSF